MRAPLSLLLLLASSLLTWSSEAVLRCSVCQSRISGQFLWYSAPSLTEKQPVCEPCSKLDTKCAVCTLPVRNHGRKLDDGRWLCTKDFEAGIFSQPEALRIYEETRRDLRGLLAGIGTLPSRNISVSLVDGNQLKKTNQAMPSEHEDRSLLGLTRTRIAPGRQFQHHIYLLNGLGRARLAAVAAHEYTHTWLHENISAERGLDHDTVEGFCELVAYKLMALRKEEVEKKVILANAYTRGQVNAFVQAEASHHFHRIVKWVKTGIDEVLPATDTVGQLALRDEGPAPLTWPPPLPQPTAVPDTLLLRGISTTPNRRYVLINDCTLTRNEKGRVRVGTSNVVVRCVDIRARSAVIQIEGDAAPRELFLGANE
jgi:hypothetical protein